MRVSNTGLLILFLLAPVFGVAGQSVSSLQQGARIRVTPVEGKATVGSLSGIDTDSLRYTSAKSPSQLTSLGLGDVRSVHVSGGRSRGMGALAGGLKGFGIGAVAGGIFGAVADNGSPGSLFYMSQGEQAIFSAVLLGAAGVIPGSIYGAIKGRDRWEPVTLRSR